MKFEVLEDVYDDYYDEDRNQRLLARKGEILTEFEGVTYGCISHRGLAMTRGERFENPFFELPLDSIRRVDD